MTTLMKFADLKEVYSSETKMKVALEKKHVEEDVITCFLYKIPKQKTALNNAFTKTLGEDHKLKAVADKYSIKSKEYKAAVDTFSKKVPVELVLNSGKPALMVGKIVCVS